MKITNHLLVGDDDQNVPLSPTPNQGGTIRPLLLVMHYTAELSFARTVSWLCDPRANASAHLVIGRDGQIGQLVPFNRRAWHAGKSSWGQLEGLNAYSIGIELVNGGKLKHESGKWLTWYGAVVPANEVFEAVHPQETVAAGWHTYPQTQIETALKVALALHERYDFIDVLGHDEVALGRKTDPGPAFAMASFRAKVLGRA